MKLIFIDWFVEYFLPERKKYCAEENLYFRIILVLDNASAHVLDYMSLPENIKAIFMPQTTAVMQLMGQGMITTLKLYYLCRTLKKLIIETYVNNELTLHEFWQIFYITDCV
jgi:hypothetical protein